MKAPSLRRWWKHITAERLALVTFLAVAVGLWWGMQPRPEWSTNIQIVNHYYDGGIPSPDGSLYLVRECYDSLFRDRRPAVLPPWVDRLRVFDLATGQEIWRWESGLACVKEVVWSKHNQLFVAQTHTPRNGLRLGPYRVSIPHYEGEILGFDPRAGKASYFSHPFRDFGDTRLRCTADGHTLAIQLADYRRQWCHIDLVDVRTRTVKPFLHLNGQVWYAFAGKSYSAKDDLAFFSPDGTLALLRFKEGTGSVLRLYEVSTGRLRQQLPSSCAEDENYCAAFSPDGRFMVTCDNHKDHHDCVRVWDVQSGRLVTTLAGFRQYSAHFGVAGLRFLDGGRLLCVSGSRVYAGDDLPRWVLLPQHAHKSISSTPPPGNDSMSSIGQARRCSVVTVVS